VTLPFLMPEPRTDPMRGYHATTGKSAQAILGGAQFEPSGGDGEWLGHGVYFWTHASMAWWWADVRKLKSPAVLEAKIVPGYCLDLTNGLQFGPFIAAVHARLIDELTEVGKIVPENDGEQRRLNCAVLNKASELAWPAIESVLATFDEGEPMFPGTTFGARAHVQICVRKLSNILYPRDVGRRSE
jgi:hypothetical protein